VGYTAQAGNWASVRSNPRLNFLDTKKILALIGKARAKALARGGGYLMKVVRQSMKTAKRTRVKRFKFGGHWLHVTQKIVDPVSKPGQPPLAHTRHLKDRIFFSLDPSTESLVVGPTKHGDGTVPRILEEGGTSSRVGHTSDGGFRRRPVKIRPRPYMAPGLKKSEKKIAGFWANLVVEN